MSTLEESVASHLELLHKYRRLISQMYSTGYVTRDDENARALTKLQQIRAVRINAAVENTYRLSPTLNRLLNEATHRARNYDISADFGEQMARLIKLMDDYTDACLQNRIDDSLLIQGDIDATLYEMAEAMNDFLLHVRTAAENNFGNVTTYKEKEKQTEHYLNQLERILKALSMFDGEAILDELTPPERETLEVLYQSHILDKLSEWRSRTVDIIHVLKTYLYKIRTVAPRARRIRALQLYLQKHPEYEVRSPDEYPEIPEWAYHHEPLKIQLVPDLGAQNIRDSLVDIAKSIEKAVAVPVKTRKPGTPVDEAPPKAALIKGSPLVVVSQRLLNEAAKSPTPISAAGYFIQAEETMVLDQESCMMCFLTLVEKQINANAKIIRRLSIQNVAKNEDDTLSGNVIIEDVLLCQR
ncbi:BAG family molecular chaperone regulator 5 [Pseudomonas sp. IT-P12]|uniref:Uncharacterized protein n=1 Tax=Pseudomonas syringae pv. actinidiae TaxID=103796 RepID=A0A7Z6UDI0_PSESF|nr:MULTISPECIES: hypothetical protein [Pseudomonas]MBH3429738.1 hypothetical protein [Pseudomonas alkylphenolica]RMR52302.1 hypothetical protein ALP83_00362 [Pseudomonas syringae pv. actinidiae]